LVSSCVTKDERLDRRRHQLKLWRRHRYHRSRQHCESLNQQLAALNDKRQSDEAALSIVHVGNKERCAFQGMISVGVRRNVSNIAAEDIGPVCAMAICKWQKTLLSQQRHS
jgi:hypothetical protein